MANSRRYQPYRLRGIHAFSAAQIAYALNNPTKRELRDELAEAMRNTAKLPVSEDDHQPIGEGA